MKQELKPCPFCGGEAKARLTAGLPYVQCVDCLVATQPSASVLIAEERWNTRPDHSGESTEMEDNRWQHPHVLTPSPSLGAAEYISESQMRYEIAKTMLPTMNHATIREDVEASIEYADELIKQLKQQNND